MNEKILILDFGSQYTQLIARKVREHNVYCEIHPYSQIPEPDETVKGVILSGSPFSVRDKHAPIPDLDGIKGKYPLAGDLLWGPVPVSLLWRGGKAIRFHGNMAGPG